MSSEPNLGTKGGLRVGPALCNYETQGLLIFQSWDLKGLLEFTHQIWDCLTPWGTTTKQQRAGFQGGD